MNDNIKQINLMNWYDYSIEKIEIKFDNINVVIVDESDKPIEILCEEYIGIRYLGHWDESVIKSIKVQNSSELTEESIKIIKNNYKDMTFGGGYRKIEKKWYELIIELIDNNKLMIVCSNVSTEKL